MDAVERFARFFETIHGVPPFPWQMHLTKRLVDKGRWPSVVALPTGAGKTAVMDIAVFSLALSLELGRSAPRRILYVVDRRLVVDSVYERASTLARDLEEAARVGRHNPVGQVADALLRLAGPRAVRPLEVVRLRGGGFLERAWVRNPAQPTIAVSTVDQIGSRLLFRGYGYARDATNELPMQAGLTGCDAVLFVDEAHLSDAFLQTARAVEQYRNRCEVQVGGTWQVVALTATPRNFEDGFPEPGTPLSALADSRLEVRLFAHKYAELMRVPAEADIVSGLALAAKRLLSEDPTARVVCVVANRVLRARSVFESLRNSEERYDVILLTGRVRPVDRDRVSQSWLPRMRAGRQRDGSLPPLIVVATQTIEVGADLDFDAMVTEIAALDALRQRLGRLDRLGQRGESRVIIVAAGEQLARRAIDPIYGDGIRRTWDLLEKASRSRGDRRKRLAPIDLGWRGFEELLAHVADVGSYFTPVSEPPILLPAHLDLLAQTSPLPSPDPDIAPLLHGFETAPPDVSVVWRADLDPERPDHWAEIVSMFPPRSGEAIELPIWSVRRWLNERAADAFDVEGKGEREESVGGGRLCLRWGGPDEDSEVIGPDDIRPGDTLLVPSTYGGCDEFGWSPTSRLPVKDVAEVAGKGDRLRLHPATLAAWLPADLIETALAELDALKAAEDAEDTVEASCIEAHLLTLLADSASEPEVALLAKQLSTEPVRRLRYPDDKGVVLLTSVTHARADSKTRSVAVGRRVTLREHMTGVEARVRELAQALNLPSPLASDLALAARLHDLGKSEPRFQAWLYGADSVAAASGPLLAKSDFDPRDRRSLALTRDNAGLPAGWRHEALSVALASSNQALLASAVDADLVLHLIASHHGAARPFLPGVLDLLAGSFELIWNDVLLHATSDHGLERIDSGVSDRFWKLVHRYGWWGLAYLEAILRLADWWQSEHEQSESYVVTEEGQH